VWKDRGGSGSGDGVDSGVYPHVFNDPSHVVKALNYIDVTLVGSDTEEDGGSTPPAPTAPALTSTFVLYPPLVDGDRAARLWSVEADNRTGHHAQRVGALRVPLVADPQPPKPPSQTQSAGSSKGAGQACWRTRPCAGRAVGGSHAAAGRPGNDDGRRPCRRGPCRDGACGRWASGQRAVPEGADLGVQVGADPLDLAFADPMAAPRPSG
jgi:hypothetical protein